MAKRRANGEGSIRKRKDGRWEGRYTAGRDPETCKPIYRNVLGRTQAETKAKLKQAIQESTEVDTVRAEQYTVGCQRQCDFVVFRRTGIVRKWRVIMYSL